MTKESVWKKPNALKTPSELELENFEWKEYQTDDGKNYYFNSGNQESVWECPEVLNELKKKVAEELKQKSLALKSANKTDKQDKKPEPKNSADKEERTPTYEDSKSPDENAKEQAKKIFKNMLREKNIPCSYSWEATYKLLNIDPRFYLLKTTNERKQVFNSYKQQKAIEERENERQKARQLKTKVKNIIENHQEIKISTKYKRAAYLLRFEDDWLGLSEREKQEVFDEAISSMIKNEAETEKQRRKENRNVIHEFLINLTDNISHLTTWKEFQEIIKVSQDEKISNILIKDGEDVLIAFEDYIRDLEKEFDDDSIIEKAIKKRQERKNRDHFIALLDELNNLGQLDNKSKWKDIFSTINKTKVFLDMLLQTGSTPLDLFKFYLEDLKSKIRSDKNEIKSYIKEQNFLLNRDTSLEKFEEFIKSNEALTHIKAENYKKCFEILLAEYDEDMKEKQKLIDQANKKGEHKFIKMLKKLKPALYPNSEWDIVRPEIENHKYFNHITDEQLRKTIFYNYVHSLDDRSRNNDNDKKKNKDKKSKRSRKSSSKEKMDDTNYYSSKSHLLEEESIRQYSPTFIDVEENLHNTKKRPRKESQETPNKKKKTSKKSSKRSSSESEGEVKD